MLEIVLATVAAVEGVALVALYAMLFRSRRHVRVLRRQLDTFRERRWIQGGRQAVKAVWETANLVREKGIGGFLSSIDVLADWAQVERPDLAKLAARDGTVTIFFSDIEGSTAMNEELGDRAWVRVLGRHDKLLRARVGEHRGHVVKTQGDGFMVAFAEPVHAVRCGVDVQRQLSSRAPDIKVRIGIHYGDAVRKGDDLFGRNVAFAARVAGEATGGEILVSAAVQESLAADPAVQFGAARDVELKGLRGTHRVHPIAY